jgi:DNA-binding NtrC family response regulator
MLKVLVVEDDMAFRGLLEEALTLFDFDVKSAIHAENAISILENHSFDIILTDITLGGMTGLELSRFYREKNSSTPIVVISGHSDSETIQEALNSGVNDYITKPFKITDLPTIITRNLAKI